MLTSQQPQADNRNLAVPIMIGAAAMIALTSIIGKTLGLAVTGQGALHPLQVSAGRFCFALLALACVLCAAPKVRPDFSGAQWKTHVLRSLCGWLGVSAMFAAVAKMPVAEATAISFLSPVVTIVLAALLLGERIGVRKVLAVALAVTGGVMIVKPGSEAFQLAGLFALAAAGFMGLEAIFIKRLSDSEPALRILVINNVIGAVISLTFAAFVWAWPTGTQWLLLVCLGAVMVCGQALFIQSMKRGEASQVIPAFYSVLVFAALFDLFFYDVIPGFLSLCGALLIISGALILSGNRSAVPARR